MNKKIPEFRNIIKIALFPSSFLVLVPGGEDRQSRRQAGMNIGNSIHRAVERFAVTRVTQSPAGLAPISRITRIRPAKREGETSEKEPRTRFCVSLTTELRNVCHTIRSRETYLFPAIIFPILDNMRFSSFPLLPLKSTFRFVRIEDHMLSMLDKRRCSKKVESLRLGFTRGNL